MASTSGATLTASHQSDESCKGVNTGFGGSADTRTTKTEALQETLIRELDIGLIVGPSRDDPRSPDKPATQDVETSTCMPESWVRASTLVRINSLTSGYSGVRPALIRSLVELLRHNIVPRIPLRGSISASGDLMPLSYLGATLEGKSSIQVWAGNGNERRIMSAAEALSRSSLIPIQLGPKEGLAIINGTAVSTGVGALAMHDANSLALLSQLLTAMSVESLRGTTESFSPFFDFVRPHPGQKRVARNIRSFLTGSKLAQDNDGTRVGSLRQDRYSIRTAPQWLGPVLEDLNLASKQITIECNSVTDNPLIDVEAPHQAQILHGGNFQAKAVTSAMEKTRLTLQTIGQMLFAQCTEIINPKTNYGLPPSLALDEPSESFLLKGVEIMMASLQSELGLLANPAGNHVQSAEMGNQSLNSLALITARYTHSAIDVLSHLASCHLLCVCQALDLRAMHKKYLETFEPKLEDITRRLWERLISRANQRDAERIDCETTVMPLVPSEDTRDHWEASRGQDHRTNKDIGRISHVASADHMFKRLWTSFNEECDHTTTMDSSQRFAFIFKSLQPILIDYIAPLGLSDSLTAIQQWAEAGSVSASETYCATRDSYHKSPDAVPLLGRGSRSLYVYVRQDLEIPFLRTSMLGQEESGSGRSNTTLGALITRIYEAVRAGKLQQPMLQCIPGEEEDGL